jgi:hypothetical protein
MGCIPRSSCKPARPKKGADLKALVRLYRRHNRPDAMRENEFFRTMPSLQLTIHHAALAIDHRGKRFGHQRLQQRSALERAKHSLVAIAKELKACKRFDELHAVIERTIRSIGGLRELYAYDTALRIGAFLGLAPEFVYLHRGTRVGARALGLNAKLPYLTVDQLPAELRTLSPPEAEDFLCIYKDHFAT